MTPFPPSYLLGGRRFQLILIALFAVASLLLAAVGTYSVLATLACWIPARRVVPTSLLNVLRYE